MNSTMAKLLSLLIIALFCNCLTVDPPPPPRLSAPTITHVAIKAMPDYTQAYNEAIFVYWQKNALDEITPSRFEVIRQAVSDSFPTTIKNIPPTHDSIYEFTASFVNLDRTEENTLFYRIFAFDSLGRPGDTSAVCTVSLARTITLIRPGAVLNDPPGNEIFKWEIPEGINRNASHIYLWKSDSLLWESDSVWYYSGGVAKYPEKGLPTHLSPLMKGETYYWAVELSIIDRNYPLSITVSKFYVE